MDHDRIVMFDGVCNLCNGFVQFLIRHDKDNRFVFASLQSDNANKIMAEHGYDPAKISTIIYVRNGHLYNRSTAALRIAIDLGGAFQLSGVLLAIPAFLRDSVYSYIARHRYSWFGQREACMIPTPELRDRFLD